MPFFYLINPFATAKPQVTIEFPIYHYLFFSGGVSRYDEPIIVLGNRRRIEAASELMQLCLYGPDAATMTEWGMDSAQAQRLFHEMRWQQFKDPKGTPVTLDRFFQTQEIDDFVDLTWLQIRRIDTNKFLVTSNGKRCTIDFNFEEEQKPPYPVHFDYTPPELEKFGIEILGGATGFTTTEASSGLVVCYNGNYMLIDAIPFLSYQLCARGISTSQVHSLLLTHIHDDHCNVLPLLQYPHKVKILTAPVIYEMFLRKIGLFLDQDPQNVARYFEFIPLEPGKETNFYGIKITAFWAIHTIPTIGAYLAVGHGGKVHRIAITGDTQSLATAAIMQQEGIIDRERYDEQAAIYNAELDLLIADGGEGSIHGDPVDCLQSPAERVVVMHVDKLSEQYRAHFSVAASGKKYSIIRGNADYSLTRTIEFMLEYFPDMSPSWISNLLADLQDLRYNAGDIILRERSHSHGLVYMILTGYAQVVRHENGKNIVLAEVGAGDLIGEMAIFTTEKTRNASVIAISSVIVSALSEATFRDFVEHEGYEPLLRKIWENRRLLAGFSLVAHLPHRVLRTLAQLVTKTPTSKIETMPNKGSLLLDIADDLQAEPESSLRLLDSSPAAYYVEKPPKTLNSAGSIFILEPEHLTALSEKFPVFRFFWEPISQRD